MLKCEVRFVFALDHATAGILAAALTPAINALGDRIMSQISAKLDALQAAIENETQEVAALNAQVAELNVKVSEGTATPDELARLDTLTQAVQDIYNAAPAPAPVPEPTPEPAPEPAPVDPNAPADPNAPV